MKFTLAAATATSILFASTVTASPTDGYGTYASYGSYQWANGAPVNGDQVSNNNPKTTDKPADMPVPPPAQKGGSPFVFTSTYNVVALGSEVRNGTVSVPGPSNAIGYFNYGINAHEDTICYNITLINVPGTYQSLARTATHIHEAARGTSGPPRLAFPNPIGYDSRRISVGCMTGPFTTGLNGADGKDTGTGFKVSRIEANPAGFFADVHTNLFPLGVVRGQLA
ncbi:023261c1-28bc-44bd-b28a-cc70113b87b8 [Sclerotinia trifoliorum]|uniref:023261c1-28bc-44bd-b28a-cc70113b87b8 n=1 Tax=Sclerotinia trifoliorum TaxID=28548 RepID=A0A8H2W0N9_9HELO|nr:023261c1-28bc-44bd-b28a-cc70113b87b8 [Sclerotinia trifoliorum]